MASGKKNYFRHSFFAHQDDFIAELIKEFGFQGYYVWWTMIELAGSQDAEDGSLVLSKLSIRRSLRLTTRKFDECLTFMERKCKIRYTLVQLSYKIWIVNLPKYLGKYILNSPKERKEKEIKENKSKVNKSTVRATPQPVASAKKPAQLKQPIGRETWEAYALAFNRRYNTDPIRNATVNSQISAFVKRIGQGDSPLVARFFVEHGNSFYVRNMHGVRFMLADAEKLYAEWKGGRKVTNADVKSAQYTDHAMGLAASNPFRKQQ